MHRRRRRCRQEILQCHASRKQCRRLPQLEPKLLIISNVRSSHRRDSPPPFVCESFASSSNTRLDVLDPDATIGHMHLAAATFFSSLAQEENGEASPSTRWTKCKVHNLRTDWRGRRMLVRWIHFPNLLGAEQPRKVYNSEISVTP